MQYELQQRPAVDHSGMASSETGQRLIQIRDLVLGDATALDKWPTLSHHIVPTAEDGLQCKTMLKNGEYGDGILTSLQRWQSNGQTVNLLQTLRNHGLSALADNIVEQRSATPVNPHLDHSIAENQLTLRDSLATMEKLWSNILATGNVFGRADLPVKSPEPSVTSSADSLLHLQTSGMQQHMRYNDIIGTEAGPSETNSSYTSPTHQQQQGQFPYPPPFMGDTGQQRSQLMDRCTSEPQLGASSDSGRNSATSVSRPSPRYQDRRTNGEFYVPAQMYQSLQKMWAATRERMNMIDPMGTRKTSMSLSGSASSFRLSESLPEEEECESEVSTIRHERQKVRMTNSDPTSESYGRFHEAGGPGPIRGGVAPGDRSNCLSTPDMSGVQVMGREKPRDVGMHDADTYIEGENPERDMKPEIGSQVTKKSRNRFHMLLKPCKRRTNGDGSHRMVILEQAVEKEQVTSKAKPRRSTHADQVDKMPPNSVPSSPTRSGRPKGRGVCKAASLSNTVNNDEKQRDDKPRRSSTSMWSSMVSLTKYYIPFRKASRLNFSTLSLCGVERETTDGGDVYMPSTSVKSPTSKRPAARSNTSESHTGAHPDSQAKNCRPKSNKLLIHNAIERSIYPGHVNRAKKERVLKELDQSLAVNFLVLFRDASLQFRGLYALEGLLEERIVKVYGKGPQFIKEKMFDLFYKYDSGSKCFTKVNVTELTVNVDGFTIQNTLWQGRKSGPVQMIANHNFKI